MKADPALLSDKEFAQACYDSPAFFARECLNIEPTPQQLELFEALEPPGAHVAVRSGHGVGKSTSLAVVALWFLVTRENAKIPCTAPSAHQLEDVLWSEIRALHSRMSEHMQDQIRIKADKVTMNGSAGFIVARTARPENPDALQGFHADNILFIIDEAAGVAEKVFEVARGALSTPAARVVMTGNPTQLSGYFHSAFHLARDSWTGLCFSCLDSPLVDPSYAEDIAREYGKDSDMYRVRVLGEFPKAGMFNLIPRDLVDAALDRFVDERAVDGMPKIIGVDPAYMGTDRSSVVMRQGPVARVLFVGRNLNGIQLAERVIRFALVENADTIFVDMTGVGVSCLDQLRASSFRAVGVAFAESPYDKERFADRRAEIWWRTREWIEKSAVIVRGEHDREIIQDLTAPEYFVQPNGKIRLESKNDMRKRGLHSPDLADALALTFAHPVLPKTSDGVFVPRQWHEDI